MTHTVVQPVTHTVVQPATASTHTLVHITFYFFTAPLVFHPLDQVWYCLFEVYAVEVMPLFLDRQVYAFSDKVTGDHA